MELFSLFVLHQSLFFFFQKGHSFVFFRLFFSFLFCTIHHLNRGNKRFNIAFDEYNLRSKTLPFCHLLSTKNDILVPKGLANDRHG